MASEIFIYTVILYGLSIHYVNTFFTFSNFLTVLCLNPLSANPTKWSNILKQVVGKLPTNCLNVFDHFVKLALKGLIKNLCPVM